MISPRILLVFVWAILSTITGNKLFILFRSNDAQLLKFFFFSKINKKIRISFSDAKVEESLEMKIFDHDYRPSDDQMRALLKKADLEGHGYKKEVTTKLMSDPRSGKTVYQKSSLYYKIVDCSRLREIEKELQTLMPGNILTYSSVITYLEICPTVKRQKQYQYFCFALFNFFNTVIFLF